PRRSEVRVLIRLCVCSEAISALAVRSAGKWRYAVYRSNNVAKRSLEEAQYKKLLEKWLLKEEHSATLKKLRNRKLYNPALKISYLCKIRLDRNSILETMAKKGHEQDGK
ncbi:hypothetical protein SDJN02_06345, partial [Cucurbita argyrosperma subsp. argyrosperma]